MRNRFSLLALACLFALRLEAHPSFYSSVALDVKAETVETELQVPLAALESVVGLPLTTERERAVNQFQTELRNYIAQHIQLRSVDGKPWIASIKPDLVVTEKDGPPDLLAHVEFTPPPGSPQRDFILESDLILHKQINHKIFVNLRSDWQTGVFPEHSKVIKVIQFLHNSVRVNLSEGNAWRGFAATFNLGLQHIAEGTDHLLFLLMLMLPAVLVARGGRWGMFRGTRESLFQLLKIVSAFTLGHSLTLILGALDWFRLPIPLVESLIAVSILVSAVHVVRPIFPERESWVAAGFGLIHGLAFSTVISQFNLGPKELVLSVLGFNLGIEAMQLAIVCILVPWLILFATDAWYKGLRLLLATFGGLAALGWLGERALDLRNPMAVVVEFGEKHALELTLILAAFIILRRLQSRMRASTPYSGKALDEN